MINKTKIALHQDCGVSGKQALAGEGREAFKRALSEDDELRLQYVDALMNRAGTVAWRQ